MKRLVQSLEDSSTLLPALGPLLLLPALLLAGKTANYDLLLVALVGTWLCVQSGLRGCAYALAMLGISMAGKHLWFTERHLWQLGLEGSVGLSFFVSTLSSQQMAQVFETLQLHSETKAKTIAHLEEELVQQRAEAVQEQATWTEKLGLERQTLEEVQTELFSVTMLNDVLRKSNASEVRAKEKLADEVLQLERLTGQLRAELEFTQQELSRLSSEDTLAQQNKALFSELNAARVKEAQTHLINETLARLHAKVVGEKEEIRAELEKLVQAHLEKRPAEPPGQYEQLYKQLKGQFEEKNNLLHQTRKELFRADTELQTLKLEMENEALQMNPLSESVRADIDQALDEHKLLEELVSHLMHTSAEGGAKKPKKKVEDSSAQDLLF